MPTRSVRRVLALCCALLVASASWLVTLPAAAAEPAQLVLVLDSSGSMKAKVNGHSKISIAKSSLQTVVKKLPVTAAVGLRVYGATVFDRSDKGACTDSQLVVPIGTGNHDRLLEEISTYQPYGETPISYSLRKAAGDLGGGGGKRTILLVSDGEETCDADPCATAAAITKNNIDVKIDVVGLAVSGNTRSQLQCVASRGNRTYYDADSQADLEASLDKLATRAFRPFRLTGTKVRGSTRRTGGPVLQPGQYVDTFIGRDKPLYSRIHRNAIGSTLRVGFTARPVGSVPTAFVRLTSSTGTECGSGLGQAISIGGSVPVVTAEAASWRLEEDSPCNTEGELLATVQTSGGELAGAPFELLVNEEPSVLDDRDLPPAETTTRWRTMSPDRPVLRPPVSGSSISDAPALTSGTYKTSILTGETQVFAVKTDWGQRVQADLRVAPRRGALARAMDVSDSLDLQLMGAGRGQYVNLRVDGLPARSYSFMNDADRFELAGSTPTVRYQNRSQPDSVRYAAVPGLQYLVLNMSRSHDSGPYLVPYTLQVRVLGTAGSGRPAYLSLPTPSPSPSSSASPSHSPTVTPPDTDPSGGGVDGLPLPAVVAIAAATMVVGAGATALALWLRRRRKAGR